MDGLPWLISERGVIDANSLDQKLKCDRDHLTLQAEKVTNEFAIEGFRELGDGEPFFSPSPLN